jgi:hypothetical protein
MEEDNESDIRQSSEEKDQIEEELLGKGDLVKKKETSIEIAH